MKVYLNDAPVGFSVGEGGSNPVDDFCTLISGVNNYPRVQSVLSFPVAITAERRAAEVSAGACPLVCTRDFAAAMRLFLTNIGQMPSDSVHFRHLYLFFGGGGRILPKVTTPPQTAARLCALNLFFGRVSELQIYRGNFLLMDNKHGKLFVIKQSKWCRFMC